MNTAPIISKVWSFCNTLRDYGVGVDVFWLKDKSLTDLDNLSEPDELAAEIIENLEAGLNSFREVLAGLEKSA